MNTAGAALFAGLSRIADLDSLQDRVRAIAGDLRHWGLRRADVRIFENWREIAQAGAGESPLRWHLDADPLARRALFGALAAFEDDGVSVACGESIARLKPAFVAEGEVGNTCLVFVQLIAGTRVIGLVIIDTGEPDPPDPAALALLHSYCDVAATLFDTERAAVRLKRDAEISEVLARIGEHTRRTLDRRAMLEHVVNDVREAFKAARCVFYERDHNDPGVAHIIAIDDTKSIQAPMPRTHQIAGSLLAAMFECGDVLVLEHVGDSPEHQLVRSRGVRALLAAPIVSENGRVNAAMSIHFARERTFSQVDFVLARSIAMHLGLALANAHLYETEQDARRRAEMLERNLRTIRGIRTVGSLLNKVTEAIVGEFGACGSAWSIREGRFQCEAADARKEAPTPSYAVGTSVAARPEHLEALRAEKIILTRDNTELWRDVASKEAMIVPLFVEVELWGFLAARIDLKPTETDLDRANFLRTLAAHAAMALGNARAFEEQRRFAHERSALSEAARLILTFNDPEALAAAMTHLVLGLIDADRAEIYVPRGENLSCLGRATASRVAAEGGLAASDPLLRRAFETGQTQIESESHVVALALPSTDHLAGVLVCFRDPNDAVPFEPQDIRLLESFGGLLGLGLRNCELYEAETRANYALAESSEFKDDLLAMFTHDFRGPLTVIMGYAELLMESLTGDARSDVATIFAQAGRLVRLADDALRLARSQATEYSLERTKCDLAAFLADALARLGMSRVALQPAPEQPIRVSIDQERLLAAIENVISNALKFSSDEVQVRLEMGGLGTARILISDQGIGIPAADLEHIFHRFGRGANARRRGIAGTGIGLYTSRKVIEAHGGTISVASSEDAGSTFTISLPTIVAPDVPPTQPEPAAVAG